MSKYSTDSLWSDTKAIIWAFAIIFTVLGFCLGMIAGAAWYLF